MHTLLLLYLNGMSTEARNIYAQCPECRTTPVYTRLQPPGLGLVVLLVTDGGKEPHRRNAYLH